MLEKKLPGTKFVVLVVLDGWGAAGPSPGNAITLANPPNFNKYWASFPHTLLSASGEAVGLPRNEPGNTETGHLNLGAGRIVYQDLPRINLSIADGSFLKNEVFLGAVAHAKANNSNLHLMGLLGAGGVHSNQEHLFALLHLTSTEQFKNVYVHVFTDGRDSPPDAALSYIDKLEEVTKREGVGQIASVMGRYWAMDRDFRWERTQKAYVALTGGEGLRAKSAKEAVENSYRAGKTDEFIEPTLITNQGGQPIATIRDNDGVIFFNFRVDRPRQLTKAFVLPDFEDAAQKGWEFDPYLVKYYKKHIVSFPQRPVFTRGAQIHNLYFVTMTEYSRSLPIHVAFPPQTVNLPLGKILSERGIRQLRVAESEKERFVTFYFNGQQELALPGEDRLIFPSPNVPTYDTMPEMSSREMTAVFVDSLKTDSQIGFALINFANPDMVGHTGDIPAATQACRVVDECLGQIIDTVLGLDGVVIVTADHGNAEEMLNSDGQPNTEHSVNPVPFFVIGKQFLGQNNNLLSGILSDVAPTILALLGIEKPSDMTGRNLLA